MESIRSDNKCNIHKGVHSVAGSRVNGLVFGVRVRRRLPKLCSLSLVPSLSTRGRSMMETWFGV